jgi:hypothetical protein
VIQAGGTGWCDDGDVIVVRCSGRGGPEEGGSESSRTWGWKGVGHR